jgi:hypothetical protein
MKSFDMTFFSYKTFVTAACNGFDTKPKRFFPQAHAKKNFFWFTAKPKTFQSSLK